MSPVCQDLLGNGLFCRLFDEAEKVRWRMTDVPWHAIERDRATPALVALVREVAASELTTFSATRAFLHEFADDADLSQWMAVWFYEETKHAQVLMRWLATFGQSFDSGFVFRGRATAPFMKSRFGTLVTNVISELVASASYRSLSRHSPEPVLAQIAKNLAADEGRHASSFYAYARRMLERSSSPRALRIDGLKVLYMWFVDNARVAHPVNEFHGRSSARAETEEAYADMHLQVEPVNERAFRMVGSLLDLAIDSADDIRSHLKHFIEEGSA